MYPTEHINRGTLFARETILTEDHAENLELSDLLPLQRHLLRIDLVMVYIVLSCIHFSFFYFPYNFAIEVSLSLVSCADISYGLQYTTVNNEGKAGNARS